MSITDKKALFNPQALPKCGSRTDAVHVAKRGFTVLEVFMVILLLTSVLTLIIVNFFAFDGALEKRPALVQLERALGEAHRMARTERTTVVMSYHPDTESILLTNNEGELLREFLFPKGTSAEIKFFQLTPETEIKSEPDFEVEENEIEQLRFFANGSAIPSVIDFSTGRESIRLRLDPFSGITWRMRDHF